jgi:hypothetical protein
MTGAMAGGRPGDLTVLSSIDNLVMTKQIRREPRSGRLVKSPYAREKFFRITAIGLGGFADLSKGLTRLTSARHAFVVRGEPLPGINREKARRLLHDDPETGDRATFAAAARHWFAVDIDKVPAPPLTDVATEPESAIEHLIGLLPPELHDASCWWQWTASQSLPGTEGTLSARLWYWSREPVDDAGLTRWALAANRAAGRKLVDPTLYRGVQPHYTASPIFDGMLDPVPQRYGIRHGLEDEVSLIIPAPDLADPYRYCVGGFVGVGVDGYLAQIGGEAGFRGPMVGAIASYYASNGPDADPAPIKSRVQEAIASAPRGGRSDQDINRYLGDRHLNDIVGWVRSRERTKPQPKKAFRDLGAMASSVPVGGERVIAVRAIAAALIRCDRIPARLALALTEAWNQQHGTPPLPSAEVREIVSDLAGRQACKGEPRNGR